MEEWRDVVGYEDYYQVSSLGRVRSKDRYYDRKPSDTARKSQSGRIRKLVLNREGYPTVGLSVNGVLKIFRVNRLVAQAFIPNPNNHPCVNHKDENKANNSVENLEWCTPKYNSNYGNCRRNISEGRKKPIVSISKQGDISWYPSAKDAEKYGYLNNRICACLHGRSMTHRGLTWRYAEEMAI